MGFLTCNPLKKTTETLCSVLIAAPLLSQDRWDEFNLIIGADVLFKTFTRAWKVEWVIFFQRCPISHLAAQSFSVGRCFTGGEVLCSMGLCQQRSVQFQIHFLHYTWRIRRMLNVTAVICLLYIETSLYIWTWPQFSGLGHSRLTGMLNKAIFKLVVRFKSGLKSKLNLFFPQVSCSHCRIMVRPLSNGRTTTKWMSLLSVADPPANQQESRIKESHS